MSVGMRYQFESLDDLHNYLLKFGDCWDNYKLVKLLEAYAYIDIVGTIYIPEIEELLIDLLYESTWEDSSCYD